MDLENKYLAEVDGLLTEKEQSLKKKIFDLSKMESFVFSQPKLTSIYEKMAETGEEKYGYHYNETIMNMIFNDYVLNNPQMLTLYKAAIPKKKKRRDKSGINQLKNDMELKSKIDKKIIDLTQNKQTKQTPSKVEPKKETEDNVDETTSAGSSGQYSGPAMWSTKGDLSGDFKKTTKKNRYTNVVEENYLLNPNKFEEFVNDLDEDLDIINEVIDPTMDFRKAPPSREDKIRYLSDIVKKNKWDDFFTDEVFHEMDDDMLNKIYKNTYSWGDDYLQNLYNQGIKLQNDPLAYNVASAIANIDEVSKSKSQQRFMGMVDAVQKGKLSKNKAGEKITKAAKEMNPKDVEDFASTKHKGLPEKVNNKVSEVSIIEPQEGSMANKSQSIGDNGGGGELPRGFTIAKGGMGENEKSKGNLLDEFENDLKLFENYNKKLNKIFENVLNERPMFDNSTFTPTDEKNNIKYEIDRTGGFVKYTTPYNNTPRVAELEDDGSQEFFNANGIKIYINNNEYAMNEERKPSSLVLKDRMGKENDKNFKKDFKQSDTKKIIDTTKELEWKDQQEDAPKNPYKYAEDLEKEELKKTKGEAFKNVGDSSNKKGDEAPKRNVTNKEQDEIDSYRDGQHTLRIKNMDKRYEDRMKKDIGDEFMKKREKRLNAVENMPMYDKDTYPTEDDKKYKKEVDDINEDVMLTGKFVNDIGNKQLIDFNLNEVNFEKEIDNTNLKKIDFSGLGNTYNNKVEINEMAVKAINNYQFYTDNKKIFAVKKSKMLNENDVTTKQNKGFNEMKHLMNYKPSNFVNTKKNKRF